MNVMHPLATTPLKGQLWPPFFSKASSGKCTPGSNSRIQRPSNVPPIDPVCSTGGYC